MERQKTKVRKLSVQLKVSILASLLLLQICVVMGLNSYSRIKTGMIEMGVEEAEMAATIANSLVDGDLVKAIVPGSEESEEYKTLLTTLRTVQWIRIQANYRLPPEMSMSSPIRSWQRYLTVRNMFSTLLITRWTVI